MSEEGDFILIKKKLSVLTYARLSLIIYNCVKCRKLHGKFPCQKMTDLPSDHLEPGPPFMNVGLDIFDPWEVFTRKTRGGTANAKRWAVLFTCKVSWGIHFEEMITFINAFKRFVAIRGKIRSLTLLVARKKSRQSVS